MDKKLVGKRVASSQGRTCGAQPLGVGVEIKLSYAI